MKGRGRPPASGVRAARGARGTGGPGLQPARVAAAPVGPAVAVRAGEDVRAGPEAQSELFKLFLVFKEVFQFLKNVVKKYQPLLTPSLHAPSPLNKPRFLRPRSCECFNMCQVSYK